MGYYYRTCRHQKDTEFYSYKDETEQLLEKHKLPQLTQDEINNLNTL